MSKILEQSCKVVFEKNIIRNFHCCSQNYAKKLHWSKEATKKTNVDRALDHFDDFYSSIYKNRWPSIRLGLLTAPKYMAVPNVFTGDVSRISESLESLGALSIEKIWSINNTKIVKEREALRLKKDLEQVHKLDETIESVTRTKQAEEMEVLYQNAPKQKLVMENMVTSNTADSRILKDVRDANEEFVTETRFKGAEDFQMESEYFSFYADQLSSDKKGQGSTTDEFNFTKISNFTILKFPPFLRPYTFEPGNPKDFPGAARHHATGLREFICVNGASLAPIIALDLKPAVTFLDLCSGPGTKTLLSLMTDCPISTTCNDVDAGRLQRVKRLFNEFMGTGNPENVKFTRFNANNYPDDAKFTRILADVPCLSDRVSCTLPDNNIFKTTRTKERIGLVHLQTKILLNAFNTLLPGEGSTVVYSTCTLSPIENDGAVGAALRSTEVKGLHVDLLGLWSALKPLQEVGYFHMNRTKFGVVIEPNIISNFGPMYVSRIVCHPDPSIENDSFRISELE